MAIFLSRWFVLCGGLFLFVNPTIASQQNLNTIEIRRITAETRPQENEKRKFPEEVEDQNEHSLTQETLFQENGLLPPSILSNPFSRNVIGHDERVAILNTTQAPYRMMGQIQIGCTGTLVGPKHVLTAGHCVYQVKTDTWYQSLTFYPARQGKFLPYGSIGWEKAFALQGWTSEHDPEFDLALIVLDKEIGKQVGWLPFATAPIGENSQIRITGYPGDKPKGTLWKSECYLKSAMTQLHYDCDTLGGMSGSSIVAFRGHATPVIQGVHTYGLVNENRGTRLTQELVAKIKEWIRISP